MYTDFLQLTYQDAYTNDSIGIAKECFSKEVFNSTRCQKYLKTNIEVNEMQKCWLAFLNSKLVGSISIIERKDDYELRGFYIATETQGKGIGKKLLKLAIDFAKDKDITLDVYAHSVKSIEIYKKWGFKIDSKRGEFSRHWPEWPKGIKARCIYMRYKAKG